MVFLSYLYYVKVFNTVVVKPRTAALLKHCRFLKNKTKTTTTTDVMLTKMSALRSQQKCVVLLKLNYRLLPVDCQHSTCYFH